LPPLLAALAVAVLVTPAHAQRALHWDAVDVEARLDASGRLHIAETQTMVFTGDWNGGERTFDVRPRQTFVFRELRREVNGRWQPLRADASADDIDEFTWPDATTLRWRSRRADDPPFQRATLRYLLRYELSNILLKDGGRYLLDHDFLFPDREDAVRRFTLRLVFDPEWQPLESLPATFTAADVPPGDGFVLTVPLRYTGVRVPEAMDTNRPPLIARVVALLLGLAAFTLLWVMGREWMRGRFAPIETRIDEAWLREHVLRHPAEVVGAAWDEVIGTPEVVALIARMVSEGALESNVGKGGVMHLRLKVDRNTLEGHERTLVDRLFFNKRVTTNTQLVKKHYRKSGFDPGLEITPELHAAVAAAMPEGVRSRPLRFLPLILVLGALGLLSVEWFAGRLDSSWFFGVAVGSGVLASIASWTGSVFRWHIEWGVARALLCLVPALGSVTLTAWFLWEWAGLGVVELTERAVSGIALLALWILSAGANAMVSRQFAAGVAFRKRLGAARAFFAAQLREQRPRLRDEWSPWLLALGLGKQMDGWAAQYTGERSSSRSSTSDFGSTATATSTAGNTVTWTGFGGGRSGGGGGGAGWTAAAGGIAAGVSPPSSSGSSGGGSSSSSSSGGGSSGGGGGGGW
jgi:hypothetical protein